MQNIYDDNEFFEGYKELRRNPESYNELIEFPLMTEQLPDLSEKRILDTGCGMGHLIQYMLKSNPDHITGIDISQNMISAAQEAVKDKRVDFVVSDLLNFETEKKFDVIVSSLALHYIKDYHAAVKKIYHLLEPGGMFIFSTEHPITTATTQKENWVHIPEEYNHHKMDSYFDESERIHHWMDKEVKVYHRTIGTLINHLIEVGFIIENVIDTGNTALSLQKMNPVDVDKVNKRPPFIIVKVMKK